MSNTTHFSKKNTFKQQNQQNIFLSKKKVTKEQKTHHDIRQDKRALERARTASQQPARNYIMMRAHGLGTNPARSQNANSPARHTVQVCLWVKPIVKQSLERLAGSEGLTVSSVGAALLERSLQTTIDMQYAAIFEPMIERAISKHLRQRDTRLISLLVRIAFDSGQTRSLVTNILGMQPEITPELLRDIIVESDRRAKLNIARKTPQMTELMENLEKLFVEQGRGDNSEEGSN
jgi:hypothetical protein